MQLVGHSPQNSCRVDGLHQVQIKAYIHRELYVLTAAVAGYRDERLCGVGVVVTDQDAQGFPDCLSGEA